MPPGGKRRSRNPSVENTTLDGSQLISKKPRATLPGSDLLEPDSLLTQCLARAGYQVRGEGADCQLMADQALFLKKFNRDISTSLDFPDNLDTMFATLDSWLSSTSLLLKLLSPTSTSPTCTTARASLQAPLLRLLLLSPPLQPLLLPRLLERLAEVSLEEDRSLDTVVSRILTAVRFLDTIVQPQGLAEKMTDILTASSRYHQVEIITSIPEIVPDQQHHLLFDCLKEMLEEREPLTSSILDCFSNLTLPEEKETDIRNMVLKLLPSAALPDLPAMVDFLCLSVTRTNAGELLSELRQHLDLGERLAHQKPSQRPGPRPRRRLDSGSLTVEKVVMDKLAALLSRDRWAAEAWLTALHQDSTAKSMDLVVLLILHSGQGQHKKQAESLLRNKIRTGAMCQDQLKEAFTFHIKSLEARFPGLLDLAEVLLLSSEGVVESFARQLYNQAFSHLPASCQQEIVSELVSKVGTGGGGVITEAALGVLSRLAEDRAEQLAKYGLIISAILDFLDSLLVSQVKVVMRVLSTLAWGSEAGIGLQTDLVILIKKQMNSSQGQVRRLGVVGAVAAMRAMLLQHAATLGDSLQPQAESSRYSAEGSSVGGPLITEATELFSFAKSRSEKFTETGGLFLDELSSMLASIKSDETSSTIIKIISGVSEDFTDKFIDDVGNPQYSIETLSAYILDNEQDSENEAISIPIAWFALKACGMTPLSGEDTISPSLATRLLPSFRLLTLSTILGEIDALLGCGIETISDAALDGFLQLSIEEKNSVLSCLFLIANWFIELMNCFANPSPTDPELETYKRKVLLRLKEHLNICDKISRLLASHPNFRPPMVQFSEDLSSWGPPSKEKQKKSSEKKGKGKKGKGKKTDPGPSDRTMNATLNLISQHASGMAKTQLLATQENNVEASSPLDNLSEYRPFFREIDLSCLAILGYQSLTTESEGDWAEEMGSPKFRPREFLWIISDLVEKLEHGLDSGKKKGFPGKTKQLVNVGFTNVMSLTPESIIESVTLHLGHILSHLEEILGYFQRLASMHDGVVDSIDRAEPRCVLFTSCLKVGFKVLLCLFSWHGFSTGEQPGLLSAALAQLAERRDLALSPSSPLETLCSACISLLTSFAPHLLSVEVAGVHLQLVNTVASFSSTIPSKQVFSLALQYLGRDWRGVTGEREKGAELNRQVEGMLRVFLSHSKDVFRSIERVCAQGVQPVVEDRNATSQEFPFVHRGSLGVVYKVLLGQLCLQVRKVTWGVSKDQEGMLEMWGQAVGSLGSMVACLKVWQNRLMLGAVLKHSRPFLDHFCRHGMPNLEKVFRRRREQCISLIKELQQVTRYLQSVCVHSKIQQDVSLANNVPQLKRTLEVLLYRNKAMLAANDCLEAFVFGNLKNKDLAGNVILSQETPEDEEESEEGDEGEEGESDVELGHGEEEESGGAGDGSSVMSEVY